MLRFLPFDRPHFSSTENPGRLWFQASKFEPQTIGIGLLTVMMTGLTVYVSRLSLVQASSSGPDPTIATIAQQARTIAPKNLSPENCQPHEVFRVSDRRCYQLQGE